MRPLTAFQRSALCAIQRNLTEPMLFLSSEDIGWRDVTVRAFHEPPELEGWIEPVRPDVALVLMARGAMLMEYKTQQGTWRGRPIQQGDLFLRPANRATNEVRWRSLSPEPMQTVHVHINPDLFSYVDACSSLMGQFGFQDTLMTQIILSLWRELEQPTQAGHLYAQSAAQLLALHLMRHYAASQLEDSIPPNGLTQAQIRQVTHYIHTHIHQKLPLPLLAKQVDFSPHHFARLFRRATGDSPHQFVLRQRISHAKHLLNTTDLPLAHIAADSGFANQSHLTHIFKRFVGLTPSAYRKKY